MGSCRAITLSTKGHICCGNIIIIRRIVYPMSLDITTQQRKLSMEMIENKKLDLIKSPMKTLNVQIMRPKLNLKKVNNIRISIRKCEE